jgi:peptide subunit release factor 1 (eRF1)
MKLLSQEQIETLAKFECKDLFTTSFFLDTSKNRLTKKEIQLSLKNLLFNSRKKLKEMSLSKAKKESLVQDLEKIEKYCQQNLSGSNFVGLAIFSGSKCDLWKVFNLVKSPRNMVIFDHNPYIRPLSAILTEYHRICVLSFDRKKARWHNIYMGEISELGSLQSDVPSRIKEGGWEGYSSKRIERHMTSRLHDFLKKTAKETFTLMKKHNFEWLFLGCKDEYYAELEPLLHPYLKEKIKSRLKVNPGDSANKILQETLKIKDELKKQEKENIVQNFISELGKDGLAVSGLENTLSKLNRVGVQTLLVTRHFSKPGKFCPKCHFLFTNESECPSCKVKTKSLIDVIDEAVEAALNSSSEVKHINPPSPLDKYGGIGAFLRYKI